MGMFNSIYTDLVCPIKKQVNRNAEIQIKWQDKNARNLNVYHIGDFLENIENEYNDTWIRTDYICDSCSKHTMGHKGISFIKTADQKRHYIFVKIVEAEICEILTEKEFKQRGIEKFVDYL